MTSVFQLTTFWVSLCITYWYQHFGKCRTPKWNILCYFHYTVHSATWVIHFHEIEVPKSPV